MQKHVNNNPLPYRDIPKLISLYQAIEAYKILNDGESPTYAEIVKMGDVSIESTSHVKYCLDHMVELGMIKPRNEYRARSIRLIPVSGWNDVAKSVYEELQRKI